VTDLARRRTVELLGEIVERCDALSSCAATRDQLSSWVSEYDRTHRIIGILSNCEMLGLQPQGNRLHEYERRIYWLNSHLPSSPTVDSIFVEAVEKLCEHARSLIQTIEAGNGQSTTEKGEPDVGGKRDCKNGQYAAGGPNLPSVIKSPNRNYIEWQGTRHPVSPGWADAFEAMIAAKGRPVGLSNFVRKPCEDLKELDPELQALISSAGNKGYFLNLF
jgi:hypothetical protein